MRTLASSALIAISLVLAAPLAYAQTDADRATARELGKDGQSALDKKDYKTAADLFHRAESLFHAPTLLLGYARSEAALGRVVNATESYNRIIREGVSPGAPQVFVDAVAAAKAEVGAVQARIATVTITITGPDDPKVTLDDTPVPGAALGVKRPIDPGAHVVKATADGWDPGQTTFTVADAGNAAASLAMTKSAAAAVAAVRAPSGAPASTAPMSSGSTTPGADVGASSSNGSTQRTLGIVAMGAGGVGLAVGAITGVLAMGKHSTLAGECNGSTCASTHADDVSSFHSMATISTIGFIAGGVLAAGGAVLFFTAPHASASQAVGAGPTVRPFIGLGTIGAVGQF